MYKSIPFPSVESEKEKFRNLVENAKGAMRQTRPIKLWGEGEWFFNTFLLAVTAVSMFLHS